MIGLARLALRLIFIGGAIAFDGPARAAVDPRAPALPGVCLGPKPVQVAVWTDLDALPALVTACLAAEPSPSPMIFGTSLRRPGRR